MIFTILLKKRTAAQNEVALSYHKVRGLYFLAVVFVRSIVELLFMLQMTNISGPSIVYKK